jgi:hypothetical protein
VYDRAQRQFTTDEISEAFAAARGLALPSQLRRALRSEGRDLHGEFMDLLPERPRPIKVQRWTFRRVVVTFTTAVLVVLLALNSTRLFRNDEATNTPVHVDALCKEMEPMWLEAQAVPSAELVPCVAVLPVGWSFGLLTVNNGRSTMTVNHDRAGSKAIDLRFTDSCDVAGATEVAADVPGTRRYERGAAGRSDTILTRYEVFDGGCATVRLQSHNASPRVREEVIEQSSEVLSFVSRARLALALDERSDGRLRLDPPA